MCLNGRGCEGVFRKGSLPFSFPCSSSPSFLLFFLVFSCRLSFADSLSYYWRGVHWVGLRVILVILHFGCFHVSAFIVGLFWYCVTSITFPDFYWLYLFFFFFWCYSRALLLVGLFWRVTSCGFILVVCYFLWGYSGFVLILARCSGILLLFMGLSSCHVISRDVIQILYNNY